MEKKVLLVNANLIKPPVTPIGLDYIGSALEKNGFEVELVDLNFSKDIKEDLRTRLARDSFLALGVTIRNTDDCYYLSQDSFLPKIKEIVGFIREYSKALIIIGGGGFAVMPQEITVYLDADLGIAGDGEFILPGLLKNIRERVTGPDEANDMKRIINEAAGGRVIRFQSKSLEDYPLPDRDLVDNKRYFKEGGMGSIETKRGCSGKCIYCADPLIKGRKVRTRPVEKVIKELKNLTSKDIDYIHFCDSELNIPADHASMLLNKMIESGIGEKIRWYSYMSPANFNEDFAKLLKRSGCEGINFGVDSVHPVILKNLGRDHSMEDLKNVSRLCTRYKIRFMFDLLLGGPGEDRETIKYTIDSVKKLNPACVGLSYGIRVYPGTALSNMISKNASMKKNLYGNKGNGKSFMKPVFYISEKIGKDLVGYTNSLVSGDRRFFIGASDESERNYNYNANIKLQEAIKNGCRGAYWDILQRLNMKL
jgi:radical SAM superfamily enzyme YgiQ (UPF0313 family)